jgi:hypothetical protein
MVRFGVLKKTLKNQTKPNLTIPTSWAKEEDMFYWEYGCS